MNVVIYIGQRIIQTLYRYYTDNGYPENIINSSISKKITQFQEQPKEGLQKCPVYVFPGLATCP